VFELLGRGFAALFLQGKVTTVTTLKLISISKLSKTKRLIPRL